MWLRKEPRDASALCDVLRASVVCPSFSVLIAVLGDDRGSNTRPSLVTFLRMPLAVERPPFAPHSCTIPLIRHAFVAELLKSLDSELSGLTGEEQEQKSGGIEQRIVVVDVPESLHDGVITTSE